MIPVPSWLTTTNVRRAIDDPRVVSDKVKKTVHKTVLEWWLYRQYGDPVDVMEEDWDNLIILDACRYDVYRGECTLSGGDIDSAVSSGSWSGAFIDANFAGRQFHDTAYVTGNPFAERLEDGTFPTVRKTYTATEGRQLVRSRMPERVSEITRSTHRELPNKRLVVHYMQPHSPYIGPRAREVRERLLDDGITVMTLELFFDDFDSEDADSDTDREYTFKNVPETIRAGHLNREVLRELYVENLTLVLESVGELLEDLDGRTVITADHGELLGERPWLSLRQKYGHPGNRTTPELRVVPWHTLDSGPRREVVSETPIESETVDESAVQAQLEALGYV